MAMNHETILQKGRYRDLSLVGIPPNVVRDLYRFMVRLRTCEQALITQYHPADNMRCPTHFCIGQEAAPAALSLLIQPDDSLFSHHRSHGYFLAKGAPMKLLLAELYGRETGADGGKAGSQDISCPTVHFYSGAIVTGAVAIAVGTGLGIRLKKIPQVAVAGFGDGATDEGLFWEAINFASLRKLPVVFLCENNLYSTYSPQWKRQPATNISERVASFQVTTRSLFGNDVIAVYRALAEAMQEARRGHGPYFLETFTYRWNGHVGPEDDDTIGYRPRSELDFWKANCPIRLLEEQMIANGSLIPEQKAVLLKEIQQEIDEAFAFADASPFPRVRSWTDLNYSPSSPVADRLLRDASSSEFNYDQADTVPKPY